MGIVVLLFSGYLFNRRIRNEENRNQLMIWGAVALYLIFSLFLNWYLREIYRWPHGIPGSDLQLYFDAAKALKNGAKISDLAKIHSAYEVSLTHVGYLAYIFFIALTVLTPTIFTIEFSLQIFYTIQGFAAITAVLNIADFLCNTEEDTDKNRNKVLWMLLLCTSVIQMQALLMRDIWILFFISCLISEIKKGSSLVKCLIYTIICFALRYYTLVITIPILIGYKYNKKKLASLASLIVFALFFVGQDYITDVARLVGIKWVFYYKYSLNSLLSYIMFPSPFNQAYNVQHLNTSFQAIFGGNTEWIYYLLSCWNMFVFPISIYGIYRSIRDGEIEDAGLWGMIIVNIAMMMCLFYNAVSSPRHKLLIIISLAYFFKKGIESIRPLGRVMYFFVVAFGLIAIFAMA